MIYIDTSVAVAILTEESSSNDAEQLLEHLMRQGLRVACSDWTCAEFRCAISAKYRAGLIDVSNLSAVARSLDDLRSAQFESVQSLPTDIIRSGELAIQLASQPLRAGDALHIAIAARIGATHFLSFDQAQAAAARRALVGVQIITQ